MSWVKGEGGGEGRGGRRGKQIKKQKGVLFFFGESVQGDLEKKTNRKTNKQQQQKLTS